ncbi:apolipoprotein N-acyltransferase [Myxococcaceae bacterium GXIMD 01537]
MKPFSVDWRRLAEPVLCAVGCSLLFALYSRIAWPWMVVGFVGLAPWFWALSRARSWRAALGMGVVMSASFTLAVFGWFATALQGYSGAPAWVCWLVLLVLSPFMQPQFITFALARHAARRLPGVEEGGAAFWRATLTGALVYVGTEWLCPKLFADTLGQGVHPSVYLRQLADVVGTSGLTLLLLVSNECVLAAASALASGSRGRRAWAPVGVLAVLVLGGLGYGAVRHAQVSARAGEGPGLKVGVVQANITQYARLAAEKGMFEAVQSILDTHFELSDALLRDGRPDLLVWPETVYPTTFGTPKSEEGAQFDNAIATYSARRGVPLVFGSYDLEGEREFNAAFFLGPGKDGQPEFTAYRKTMLFPLTEWVPEALDTPWLRERLPWLGTWQRGPGPRAVPFRLAGGRSITVAPLICYEAIFPDFVAEEVRQGADLIITLSNDSWFSRTPAPRLHLVLAAFRSIETRRPQVRVTNSGISAFIDPTGEILTEVADGTRESRAVMVRPVSGLGTLALAWGDWVGPTALALGLVLLAGALLAGRRVPAPAVDVAGA